MSTWGTTDGALDQINVNTQRHIRKNPALLDGIFQNDPFMAILKSSCVAPYTGGNRIAENLTFDTLLGGGYNIGEEFDLSEQKTDDQIQFFPKFLEANVTMTMEEIEVINVGPNAIYRTVNSKLKNGYNSMGSWLAISLYLKNTTTGYDRLITGLAEALGYTAAGTTAWDGTSYTTYGGLTRSAYNGALTSNGIDAGGNQIEYDDLENALSEASWGTGEFEPNYGVTTVKGLAKIKQRFQTQQRLTEQDAKIGFKGLGIGNATIIASRYCPGQDIATSGTKANRVATKFLKATTRGAVTSYPSVSGETLFFLNARKPHITLYISTSRRYSFGFTGFKVTAGNTKVSGQVLWSGQLVVGNPSFHSWIKNFA